MNLKIMNYGYYNNKSDVEKYNAPILLLFCRDEKGNFHVVYICDKENLAPEMYIPKNEIHIAKELDNIITITDGPPSNYGEETLRLTTTFPWEVRRNRDLFSHTFLSDIKWEKMCIEKMGIRTPYITVSDDFKDRWLTVKDIKELNEYDHFYVKIRTVIWDIETNGEPVYPLFNGYDDAEICDIISITAYDNYTEEYHRFIWHPLIKEDSLEFVKNWERRGEYYVPALKKKKKYFNVNKVFNHNFTNEVDMLKNFIDWIAMIRPDVMFGFNSEGGYKISTKKGYSRKYYHAGFDMPYFYKRCKALKILDYMEKLSPLPNTIKGVKWRSQGKKGGVSIEGLCQIDFIYTNAIFMYDKKFNEFREGNLDGYMKYFVGFGKVHHKEHVWELWKNNETSDYDPTNPEQYLINKERNLVKELYTKAKKIFE